MIEGALLKARRLIADGDDIAARQAYLAALHLDPRHPVALTELGALAHAGGYLSAAREAFRQAVRSNPDYLPARVGYGDLLREAGDPAAACLHYQAALASLREPCMRLGRTAASIGARASKAMPLSRSASGGLGSASSC